MSKLTCYSMVVLLSLAFYLPGKRAEGQEITFCSMPLSKAILEAHTSFNAIYKFDVDQNGEPINIKPVSKQFTKPEDVRACISQWSFPKAASKHLVAVFEWHHGIGWTTQSISGDDVKLIIRFNGQRCPYCSTTQP